MIKVLIVDDEPKLREGLKAFIDWESYGYTVVDTAANGHDALSKYEQYHPDLVIADIRMPGMDGLQLIQRLRDQDEDLHILILSGYADFDYAKKAITYRADGYLLKPVDEDELIGYLASIKQAIDLKRISDQWTTVTKEWTREALITSLLEQTSPTDDDQLKERAEELGLLWHNYQILLVTVQCQDDSDTVTPTVLKKKLIDLYENTGRGYVFYIHSQIGVLLNKPLLSVEQEGLYTIIEDILSPAGAYFTAAIGSKVTTLQEVKDSFEEARELMRQHFILDNGNILSKESIDGQFRDVSCETLEMDTFNDQLYYAIDVGNREAAEQLISRVGQFFIAEGYGEGVIKRRFVEILNVVASKVLQKNPELQGRNKDYTDTLAAIYQVRSLNELYQEVNHMLIHMMNHVGEEGKHREVKIMLDLIHRNYSDNLKLETLAGVFNYNSAYLGKLFKNETGEYFNTYLDKVRIDKAKSYLEQGYKVYQVAEKVGYTSVDYFHSKFRKYVGTSPSAYRKEAESV